MKNEKSTWSRVCFRQAFSPLSFCAIVPLRLCAFTPFVILIMFSLIAGSCSGRKNKLEKQDLIPEKELVSLLVDIHIADGLLTLPKISAWTTSLDSITSYYHVIENHGYTKDAMDRTMRYYFIKKPKKLNEIYDQVLGILSEMESRVEKESVLEIARISNLWRGKDFYSLPDIPGNDSTTFAFTVDAPGTYLLSFSITLFPDDQSLNPRANVYLCSPDSIQTGKRRYIKSAEFIKDGLPHTCNLTFSIPVGKMLMGGCLYYFDNSPYVIEQHVLIDNISLTLRAL